MEGPTKLPRSHPLNVRGEWVLVNATHKPGEPYDLVYHDDDGNDIAYMKMIHRENGAFAYVSDKVHASHSHLYARRNHALVKTQYGAIHGALKALGDTLAK